MRTIQWNAENSTVRMIDQTLLPVEYREIECENLAQLCEAIKSLRVRGAPALAAAGAYGIALASKLSSANDMESLLKDLKNAARIILATRPTAINLGWGVNRVVKAVSEAYDTEGIRNIALNEAQAIADEDVQINKTLGKHGASLLEDGDTVMTHCNAGRLACVDWGTALGVVRSAVEQGKDINVIACETRPLNQGGRLTTWELMQDNIPVKLSSDSMSGYVMRHELVDKVVVGADRITEDAVFNKIGTYNHAIVAMEHEIPFYVAAPASTFDFKGWEGSVKIEERDPDELRYMQGVQIAPEDVPVINPAFDSTPMEYIEAIITEKGIFRPPFLIDEVRT